MGSYLWMNYISTWAGLVHSQQVQFIFIFTTYFLAIAFTQETKNEESMRDERNRNATANRLNVLLFIIDDMRAEALPFLDPVRRPWLNHNIRTPNLEALAKHSLVLTQAYAQETICNPSRSSFLTSRRPDTTRVYDALNTFREACPDIVTLPQYFLQNGYKTLAVGKVFHTDIGQHDPRDEKYSWSQHTFFAKPKRPRKTETNSWRSVSAFEQKDQPLEDQQNKDIALQLLEGLATNYTSMQQNFFLAVGFRKPHLPFVCPEEHYSKYDPVSCSEAENGFCPHHMAEEAWSNSIELLNFANNKQYDQDWTMNSSLPLDTAREHRRGYYSCVTYTDQLVGEVLQKLDDLRMRKNTIVALLGDHGWHLGENGIWGKTTLFEAAAHAPMMISIPGMTSPGLESHELVELVDLAPTLAEAAGLEKMPICPASNSHKVPLCTEGMSLMPLITHPNKVKWRNYAYTQYPYPQDSKLYMGYSIRTKRFRYNEWLKTNHTFTDARTIKPRAVELYDMDKDPRQNFNRANDPSYAEVRQLLSDMLRSGWYAALPK